MAREKHIVDLTIGNFKRFANFEVKNLGQFNLIVGDNNTGKTSFLEALIFDEDENASKIVALLSSSLFSRSQDFKGEDWLNYLYQTFDLFLKNDNVNEKIELTFKSITNRYNLKLRKIDIKKDFEFLNEVEKQKIVMSDYNHFILDVNNRTTTTLIFDVNLGDDSGLFAPFVAFGIGYAADLLKLYLRGIDINIKIRTNFIKNLKVFIPKINDIRVGNKVINIYEEGMDTPMPLFTYGEGANKLFRILCEIAMCKGKRLMIDEIDAGIHYSRFKSFWRTIMQAARAYDVQIFATTHNIECVEYFREVLEEEVMQDYQDLARIVSLKVKEDNSVKARVYDYEYMEYAKDANRELRGGGL